MKFSVDLKIFEKFPGVTISVLVITGMDNTGHSEEILALLRNEEKHQKEMLKDVELGSLSEISIWRKIYKDFGSGKDYRSSVEALLRRARGGEKPLPQINNLVDLYNYLSLKYHLPAGAEDMDKVVGDIELTFALGDEKGKYIGGETEDICDKGEVIYKDKAGFICRRWNWREADRTKIEQETKNCVLVIEKAPGLDEKNFQNALVEAQSLLKKYFKAKVQVFLCQDQSPSFEIDIKSGSKAVIEKKPDASQSSGVSSKVKVKKPISTIPSFISSIIWENGNALSYQIKKIIFQAVREVAEEDVQVKLEDVKIEHPANENYGDYSTNIALVMAGKWKKAPLELAKIIEEKINRKIQGHQTVSFLTDSNNLQAVKLPISDILEKVEVVKPGFLNLWLRKDYLITQMLQLLKNGDSVRLTQMQGKKVAVEYTDPNPFKEFHLGHLYSNFIGESIALLLEASGALVWRGDFYGDVGMHIAKSLYGLLAKLKIKNEKLKILKGRDYISELERCIEELEKLSIGERQKFLGEGYAIGTVRYDEDEKVKEEIKDMNYLIYIAGQEILKKQKGWQPIIDYKQYVKGKEERLKEIGMVYEAGLRWSLEYFETIYKKLGTKFDGYYPESWVGEYGMKLVEKGLKMGILEKTDGAVVYRGEKDGLHTRVFVNKLGLPTYEAKDLGLAYVKYQDFPYDFSINVFGKEIDEYYKVVKAALEKIEPELGKKAFHIPHGMVKLPEGKMSSRSGNVVTFVILMEEAKKQALKIMKEIDINEAERQTVAEAVALGAIRYALLKGSLGNDVIFDFEKSISFDGDSGPYLLYTYARCKSVIRKSKVIPDYQLLITNYHPNLEELTLLRTIYRFPEVILEATRTFSPNLICAFLFDLAQKYNLFYDKHSILGQRSKVKDQNQNLKLKTLETQKLTTYNTSTSFSANSQLTTAFRLAITAASAQIIKQGLALLGIKTIERM